MASPSTAQSDIRNQLAQASSGFADAVEHVARACRQRLNAIASSVAAGDFGVASDRLTALAESREVVAVGSTLAGLKLDLRKLQADIAASGPLGKIVIGLTAVAAGGLGGALITSIFGAAAAPTIALLLIAGGILYALAGLSDLIGAATPNLDP